MSVSFLNTLMNYVALHNLAKELWTRLLILAYELTNPFSFSVDNADLGLTSYLFPRTLIKSECQGTLLGLRMIPDWKLNLD